MCDDVTLQVTKLNKKFEVTQKTLSQILAKLINLNTVHPEGFVMQPANTTFITSVTTSITIMPTSSNRGPTSIIMFTGS